MIHRRHNSLLSRCGFAADGSLKEPLDPEQIADIMKLLQGKLSDEDLAKVKMMLETGVADPSAAMDGVSAHLRENIWDAIGQNRQACNRDFVLRHPTVSKIGLDPNWGRQPRRVAAPAMDQAASDDFAKRFPGAAKIGHV